MISSFHSRCLAQSHWRVSFITDAVVLSAVVVLSFAEITSLARAGFVASMIATVATSLGTGEKSEMMTLHDKAA